LAGSSLTRGGGAIRRAKFIFIVGLVVAMASAAMMLFFWGEDTAVEESTVTSIEDLVADSADNPDAAGAVAELRTQHIAAKHGGFNRILTFADAKHNKSLIGAGRCYTKKKGENQAYCLPSLVCIGAMKAGTFELKQWLDEHPRLAAAAHERHFFGHGTRIGAAAWHDYAMGAPEWRLTRQQIRKGTVTFEKTPYYLASPVAALEMHRLLGPRLRLVALLRDPVARAYSSFYHHCDRNRRIVVVREDKLQAGLQAGNSGEGKVVFNADCALVEHCCCAPSDLAPPEDWVPPARPRSHEGVGAQAVAALWARLGNPVGGASWPTLKNADPRLGQRKQARPKVKGAPLKADGRKGGKVEQAARRAGKEVPGAARALGEAEEASPVAVGLGMVERGNPLGGLASVARSVVACDPETFDRYLESTELDPESPHLGTILRKGLYAAQLGEYMRLFGRSHLLVMDFKAFATDPQTAVNRVFSFAGLKRISFQGKAEVNGQGFWYLKGKDSKSNKQKPYGPMLDSSRKVLGDFYRVPDRELKRLFPDEPFSWIKEG